MVVPRDVAANASIGAGLVDGYTELRVKNGVRDRELVQRNRGKDWEDNGVISGSTLLTAKELRPAGWRRCPHMRVHRNISRDPLTRKLLETGLITTESTLTTEAVRLCGIENVAYCCYVEAVHLPVVMARIEAGTRPPYA